MTFREKLDAALAIGDRLVLWLLVLGLASVVGWMALDAERNSPTLIAPTCVTVEAKVVKP